MSEESKKEEAENKDTSRKNKYTDILRQNPWVATTIVLGILSLILIIGNFGMTGKTISKNDAGEELVAYLATLGYDGFEVLNVEDLGNLYLINTSYQGSDIPFYVTKDGYIIGNSLISIIPEEETEEAGLSKSDNPSVGLYIWSYCPYGVTALAPFAEVASLLDNYADFKVYLYYAGHGDFEEQQNKIQACIQDLDYGDKYWEYAEGFANNIYESCYGDIDCNLEESVKLMKSLGIDSDEVMSCVESQGDALLEEHYNAAKSVGVTGSPSLVIDGVKVSSSRNAEAYKDAVCSAFNTAPKECGVELDSTSSTSSGNC